ncbi:hypothetical protein O0I10_007523 [Lichtheimia ornata]|uniref:Uncharacterized protein n=1 Tax=Lichtheimia ornata TaxID=688661 RepID=A0AAD7XXP3_9FUNG|nr:uncharacterized protein O0I10_007523 [Lichtheimia ornata]KAJ8656676.1 hypothetical protein O0I10_007523 [Lichtheimia ornata]
MQYLLSDVAYWDLERKCLILHPRYLDTHFQITHDTPGSPTEFNGIPTYVSYSPVFEALDTPGLYKQDQYTLSIVVAITSILASALAIHP